MVSGLFEAAFEVPDNLEPRYNICPTQKIVVARVVDGERRISRLRWGLLPRWYKTPSGGPLLINARAETIADKPAFKSSCRTRRCLVPASGFYEWTKAADGGKDPHYLYPATGDAFAFAGIWRDWVSPEGEVTSTVAIVTCAANDDIRPIHHRMPVIIDPQDFGLWLGEKGKGAAVLMRPAPLGSVVTHPVSRAVNGIREDKVELTARL